MTTKEALTEALTIAERRAAIEAGYILDETKALENAWTPDAAVGAARAIADYRAEMTKWTTTAAEIRRVLDNLDPTVEIR